MNKKDYARLADIKTKNSPILRNCCFAFLVGGAICCVGQAFSDLYSKVAGFSEDDASVLSSVTLVFLSALFTGLGLYQKLARIAGAGTLVPITGSYPPPLNSNRKEASWERASNCSRSQAPLSFTERRRRLCSASYII